MGGEGMGWGGVGWGGGSWGGGWGGGWGGVGWGGVWWGVGCVEHIIYKLCFCPSSVMAKQQKCKAHFQIEVAPFADAHAKAPPKVYVPASPAFNTDPKGFL